MQTDGTLLTRTKAVDFVGHVSKKHINKYVIISDVDGRQPEEAEKNNFEETD